MYSALIRRPLQQVMVLLLGVGVVKLGMSLGDSAPGLGWALSALLGSTALTLFAGRFRRPALLPAAVVVACAGVVTVAQQFGIESPAALATVTALYALSLWYTTIQGLTLPAVERLAALLDLRGGFGGAGGRDAVERYIHWTSFAITIFSLVMSARAEGPGAIPGVTWPVLALGLVFLWLAGARYRLRSHSYLIIGLGVWGSLSAYGQFASRTHGVPLDDAGVALLLACLSVGSVAAARLRWAVSNDTRNDANRLYIEPLQVSGLVLAFLAVGHVAMLVISGAVVGPGWTVVAALGLAALTMIVGRLAHPAVILTGVLLAALSACWLYSAAVLGALPFGLWPTGPASGGQWLLLAIIPIVLASLAQGLSRHPTLGALYAQPLFQASFLVWAWAFPGALAMFLAADPAAPWIIAGLIGGVFPMLRVLDCGAAIRGVAVALLSTLCLATVIGIDNLSQVGGLAALLWAYVLWGSANFVLPVVNQHFPRWTVAPQTWPWFGLVLVGVGVLLSLISIDPPMFGPWVLTLSASVYLFAMLRNSAWPGFAWLGATSLLLTGALFSVGRHLAGLTGLEVGAFGGLAVEGLIFANLSMLLVALWRRHGAAIGAQLGLLHTGLGIPLLSMSFLVCAFWQVILGAWDAALIVAPDVLPTGRGLAVGLGLLLSASLLHGLVRWRNVIPAHLLVTAVFLTVVAGWGAAHPFHLPLLLALWHVAIVFINVRISNRPIGLVAAALRPWIYAAPAVSLISLALFDAISTAERLLTLCVLAGTAGALGIRGHSRPWLYGAAALVVTMLHGVWLLWIPRADAIGLLPWYALQSALVVWGLNAWLRKAGRTTMLHEVALKALPWLGGLALLEWSLHLISLLADLVAARAPQLIGGSLASAAQLGAACVLAWLGIGRARLSRTQGNGDWWVYAVAMLAAATGIYCRITWQGLAPLGVWDTAAILGAAYGLLVLQRITDSAAILKLVMLLPLLAIATVPFQLASAHAGLTLFAIGTLYLLARHATGQGTPLYLGLLALNAAVYLWVPDWAERYGLLQVYLVPAALSVLLLLHLHRRELKSSVANGVRLAALSTLYAVATMDVFIQEQLSVFVLALALSLSGIIVGIMLRTRAFLYAGVAFLVVNVLGQMVQLYPDQRLGRALVLMAMGAGITGAMIWFNLKRETVMARIRVFRADLAGWD